MTDTTSGQKHKFKHQRRMINFWRWSICFLLLGIAATAKAEASAASTDLIRDFEQPPDSARPWVYWFFMDGNLSREGMTADLEAMKRAGIGGAIILEVDLGIPRGNVRFMSEEWRELIRHAVNEADRLGLQIAIGSGPGWCGTGGPWVKPEQSMQDLVASDTSVRGPAHFDAVLPQPAPRTPFFGIGTLTPELAREWKAFYRDVAVLAFPTPVGEARIKDIDEKALYYRAPYSSQPGVRPFFSTTTDSSPLPAEQCVPLKQVINLSNKLGPDGHLVWDVPAGNWTILRFGRTSTGQITRPAPAPGLGFETDKFDKAAIDAHFAAFIGTLLKTVGRPKHPGRGLTMLHFDSWEMSSQNWSAKFREEFQKRRHYDPLPFLPAMTGRVVGSREKSERFLWDLRQTAQELVLENHLLRLKQLGRRYGLKLSVEPYDMDPCSDLTLGSAADVPMCEFWSQGWGFKTEYSCFEAVSIGHTLGHPIIAAEAFTAAPGENWMQYPGSMKAQADWALCCGINRFVFHRYQHQPWLDRWPGMTMGPYGVHWERTQTWWEMSFAFHKYLARCQEMLRRGLPVADILYLVPEGAPNVFRPPSTATRGDLPDRLGHNFDGCAPETLIERASVKDGRITFPDGMNYRVLVLPYSETMRPPLLRKIKELVEAGATVIGTPPRKSPSLEDYPHCDEQVRRLAAQLWGEDKKAGERRIGRGRVICDNEAMHQNTAPANPLAQARWIWYDEGNPVASAPVGKRLLRRLVVLAATQAVESAEMAMTADNSFKISVNGRAALSGNDFHKIYSADVTSLLKPGTNLLAVVAENGGDQANPAGLIGALTVHFHGGGVLRINTDKNWSSALTPESSWRPVRELGSWDMLPWKLTPAAKPPELYPSYDMVAGVLTRLGVTDDFAADNVRYIHRHDGNTDIFFVANRENRLLATKCRFRVAGRQPEWWDPLTGERRTLPNFELHAGVTTIPLRFDRQQSAFIVFREPTMNSTGHGRNFPELKLVETLKGPWQVAFDPKWGGPEHVTFEKLEDWTHRPEPGIRYYSGTATYRLTFAVQTPERKFRWLLDLGKVAVMARARLNGRDLGVAWCAPWRLVIPDGVLRARDNQLEIAVANLWPNRLIGDAGLPPEQRHTWTTLHPFTKDTPLVESGLLGPVTLLQEQ